MPLEADDLYQVHYGGPNGGETIQDRYSVFRNSLRLKYRFVIHDKVILEGVELIQHSLATIHNYILAAFNFNKFTRTRSENTFATFGFTITR